MCLGQPELHSMILISKKKRVNFLKKEKSKLLFSFLFGAQRERSWICGVSGGFTR